MKHLAVLIFIFSPVSFALTQRHLSQEIVNQTFRLDLSAISQISNFFIPDFDQAQYQPVSNQYGSTVIAMNQLPLQSGLLDSGRRAWSSWWFQKSQKEFTGHPQNSILAKYDRALGLTGTSGSAFSLEFSREKNQYAAWEGLCDAWAMASLFYSEPKRGVSYQGVQFSVSDLKGLILKTFEATPESDFYIYGERFQGNQDGWVFPDLFPDQFHRLIEVALGQKKVPLIMDRDPGLEVWTVPVYKANYRIDKHPTDSNAVIVKMWLYTAGSSPQTQKDDVGTQEVIFEYAYELRGDLSLDGNQLTVTSGKWLQIGFTDSRVNHPDYFLMPKSEAINRNSYNNLINKNLVDNIVRGAL